MNCYAHKKKRKSKYHITHSVLQDIPATTPKSVVHSVQVMASLVTTGRMLLSLFPNLPLNLCTQVQRREFQSGFSSWLSLTRTMYPERLHPASSVGIYNVQRSPTLASPASFQAERIDLSPTSCFSHLLVSSSEKHHYLTLRSG